MSARAQRAEYCHVTVENRLGEAYHLLSKLSGEGINLLGFNAVPLGMLQVQMMLFTEDSERLMQVLAGMGVSVRGPEHAFLVTGDDELGALAALHRKLLDAQVDVYASGGVTDGRGGFGYVIHVRPDAYDQAARALGL